MQRWVAIVSLVLLVVKFYAYFRTGSIAILTDAMESIVNVAAGLIGLYSLYVAAKPRDANHPYGHGKAEFLSAAVEGTLIGIAGVVILYKAVMTLIYPVAMQSLDLGILLVAVTALVNAVMGYLCIRTGDTNNSLALVASGRHLYSDALSTIGIIGGLFVIRFTGWIWADSVVAIIFGFVIVYTGYGILRKSIAGIMDEADEQLLGEMVTMLNGNRQPNWVDLHNLRVIKYGSILHIDCHLTVPWYLNVLEAHADIDKLSGLVRGQYGESVELFVHSDGCMAFQCHICEKKDCHVRQQAFDHRIAWTLENISNDKKHGATAE